MALPVIDYSRLLQFDPSPWCDADMRYTPMDIKTYQLPDPTWEWVTKEWMVDMTEDVDEAGWQYALKFHGAVWHGNYKHFRSFVRRRRWVRLRHRCVANMPPTKAKQETHVKTRTLVNIDEPSTSKTHHGQQLYDSLKQCHIDRERLVILEHAISSMLPGTEDELIANAQKYMALLDYESSKRKFVHRLLALKYSNRRERSLTFTADDKKALQSLRFYSDVQSVISLLENSAEQ
ncbi:hypothetical protein EC973_004929 [Apophysomyces ossiformis]|uniref:Peroxin/Ferlin domain-containing protein n=1 Tax=Apophysomyces ossiformis TaxID=679940 RepID=A0A8H7ER74_9FUNG|nr:hypothetical protein EC973_004929 [Apophysomyces ossiformis]